MPKLKKETVENKYRIINNLYEQFTYEIAVYGTAGYSAEGTKEVARKLRLELKKFI